MSIASQDYRDGAAYGALELYNRIRRTRSWGLEPNDHQLRTMAEEIAFSEMGGRPDLCAPCGGLNGRHSDTCPIVEARSSSGPSPAPFHFEAE